MVARLLLHLTGADHTVLQTLGQRLGSTFVYDHHYGRVGC